MADKTAKYVITAEDRTGPAVTSVKSQLNMLEGMTGKLSSAMTSMTSLVAGSAALGALGKIAASFNETISAADNLGKLSQKIGISVKDLVGLQHAADLSDVSIEQLGQGVKQLSRYMAESGDKLRATGVTAADATGAMMQIADAFAVMPDGVQKTAVAMELFGKSGAEMIPMLNGGGKALRDLMEEGQRLNPITDEMTKRAEKLKDTMTVLAKTFDAIKVEAVAPLIPEFQKLANAALVATKDINGLYDVLDQLQKLTQSGPLSIFSAGKLGVQIAALNGSGGDQSKRLSVGRIGGNTATPAAPAKLGDLLGKPAKVAKAPEIIDVFGNGSFITKDKAVEQAIKESFEFENWAWGELAKAKETDLQKTEALRQKYIELADPLQQYRVQLDEINSLLKDGKLTPDQAISAEWRVNEQLDAALEKMLELSDATQQQNALTRDLGMTFSSAFEDAIVNGKNLSETLKGLSQDVQRIVVRKTITEPLANALTDSLKDFNIGSLFKNADGGVYAGPGIGAYSGSIVSRPTVFPFASGIGLMGEAGPEAILPLSRSSDGKLGVKSSGSGLESVRVEIVNQGSRQLRVDAAEPRFDAKGLVVSVVLGDLAQNGPIAQSIGGRYGLRGAT